MQATTHVPKILKKLAETKGTRVWDDAFRSYNDPRFVSFEGITGFKDFYLNISRNKVFKDITQRGKTSTRMVLWPQ
ncbi:MAG: hypothetical protein IRF16MM_02810 [Candidatus Midichloria mitochondrii]|nr:transposase [Candidatus Midichloria mitochondrii]